MVNWNQPFISLQNAYIFAMTSLLGILFCVHSPPFSPSKRSAGHSGLHVLVWPSAAGPAFDAPRHFHPSAVLLRLCRLVLVHDDSLCMADSALQGGVGRLEGCVVFALWSVCRGRRCRPSPFLCKSCPLTALCRREWETKGAKSTCSR